MPLPTLQLLTLFSPEHVWFDLQQAGELAGLRAGFFAGLN
ncbi:hypothetical protein MARINON1_50050 [Marinobacter salarius]|nr:hypothetical protein MARINON1_50050 [Marinobacter salarius]